MLDFKKRFGKQISIDDVRSDFVTKINHFLVPVIEEEIGRYYTEAGGSYGSPGSRLFDAICIGFGLEPHEIIKKWNRNPFSAYELGIPPLKQLTGDNFEKTLLLIEIVYQHFREKHSGGDAIDAIESIVNQFILQPISLGVFWRNGKFYPEGATELDEPLVREPLEWLEAYPKVQSLFKNALDAYSQSIVSHIKRKDTVVNAYQAVEEIARLIVGEQKPFDSIYPMFGEQIGLNQYWRKILNNYREFSMEYGRHPGKSKTDFIPDKPSTEAFLYLSGLLLRLSINVMKK